MSNKIGRVDFSKEILKFLKLYNAKTKKVKKIQKAALKRLDRFLNIVIKTLIVNCAEMLTALKLLTLNARILYTVYDITLNGSDEGFTKKSFEQFQNVLVRDRIEDISGLSYDSNSVMKTKVFDLGSKQLISKVLVFWGILTNPRATDCDLLIEFLLVKIFEANDCEIITTDVLETIGILPDFAKLDEILGSYGLLTSDAIEVSPMEKAEVEVE